MNTSKCFKCGYPWVDDTGSTFSCPNCNTKFERELGTQDTLPIWLFSWIILIFSTWVSNDSQWWSWILISCWIGYWLITIYHLRGNDFKIQYVPTLIFISIINCGKIPNIWVWIVISLWTLSVYVIGSRNKKNSLQSRD